MEHTGQQLLALFKESVIIQACVTLLVIGATVYMVVSGQEVPKVLETIDYLVVGFYFGSKAVSSARQAAVDVAQAMRADR